VSIPFTILDAILMDKSTLEGSQLLVDLEHGVQRLDKLGR
jgi:hypothetical protein